MITVKHIKSENRKRDKKRKRIILQIGSKSYHITIKEAVDLIHKLSNEVEKGRTPGYVRCSQCHRFGPAENIKGLYKCPWDDCLWLEGHKIKVRKKSNFKNFRDAVKKKRKLV